MARRRARVLLLRGGCRRELDQASGAWQYVWRYHSVAGAALGSNTRERDSESRLSCRAGGGGSGGGGKTFFRSWYPPALLKNEALPSPRAATRRVKTEGRKREARLAFANSLLDGQKGVIPFYQDRRLQNSLLEGQRGAPTRKIRQIDRFFSLHDLALSAGQTDS